MRGASPGERRGGRQKGTPNRITAERQRQVQESGLTPLDHMLNVMRDETRDPTVRLDAAKAAAPYVHPRLANIEANVRTGVTHEVALEMLARMKDAATVNGDERRLLPHGGQVPFAVAK